MKMASLYHGGNNILFLTGMEERRYYIMKSKNETQATINAQAPDNMTQPQELQDMEPTQANEQQVTPTATQDEAEIAALEAQQEEAAITTPSDLQATTQQAAPVVPADAWSYFCGGHFDKEVDENRPYATRKTGFDNLDMKQRFAPGLYILGGVSATGKTTFAYQLADQMATQGEDVLYFSLEQTKFELFSKSISREFFLESEQTPFQPTYSSFEIRCGLAHDNHPMELQARVNSYLQKVGDRLKIITLDSPPAVETIASIVEGYIQQTGRKPFVVVDYLQIIKPTVIANRPLEGRASIDHIITSLKNLQMRLKLTLLAISSINRANYTLQIDFESFKESGMIEYTADAVWALQLAIVSKHPGFNGTGKNELGITAKRKLIQEEKARNPRLVELVCLKTRHSVGTYTVDFEYYPASDAFMMPIGAGGVRMP